MYVFDWKLILEYLRVLLTWPPVVLVIFVIFSFKFTKSINQLIGRIIKAKIFGQEIDVAPDQSKVYAEKESLPGRSARTIGSFKVKNARRNMPLPPELENDPHAKDAIQWVKQNPELTVVEYKKVSTYLGFERLFNAIYGTQISLLDFLALRPNEAIEVAQLVKFHKDYLDRPGSVSYEFSAYIIF